MLKKFHHYPNLSWKRSSMNALPRHIFSFSILSMPLTLSTAKIVSAPRHRRPLSHKPPPIPSQQRKEKLAARQENQRLIDNAVSEWYTYTLAKADDLGKRFNKKPRYFLDIFFQGGAKMVHHHQKTNAYNAFKSLKAAELHEGLFLSVALRGTWHTDTSSQKGILPGYKLSMKNIKRNMRP
jgi:hypothetical protein